MSYICCGCDPGLKGGIGFVTPSTAWAEKMPETDRDLLDLFLDIRKSFPDARIFARVEHVASSPQMGVVSAFTFGRGYGALQMALLAAEIPFEFVTPAVWQKALGCRSGGDKNVTKAAAQRLFPSIKMSHAIADSLLIAEYCRRTTI